MLVSVLGVSLFQKQKLSTYLTPGMETVSAQFAGDYRLRPFVTKVKVSGIAVGVVTSVEPDGDGAKVTMDLDSGTSAKLGASPSAAIRPSTLLGGNYYVELKPGGDPARFKGTIPLAQTSVPVELDRVLEALQPDVRTSMRGTIANSRQALDAPTRKEIKELLQHAPNSLDGADGVLRALRGERPEKDLGALVSGLEATARALTKNRGDLDKALAGLDGTADVIGRNGPALRDAVADLPDSLRTAREGLDALDGTLTSVREVSESARPTVRELDGALASLEPALRSARPLMNELVPTLNDLRPVVQDLLQTSVRATEVLGDLDGKPLERVTGPITDMVLSPWHGPEGSLYEGNGNDTPFYQELGYMAAGGSASGNMTDRNGPTLHFQPGAGPGTVTGLPISFEDLFRKLLRPDGSRP
ncbi:MULTISPECIES: MlaD family protein [unclassified Nocardioides]|uniref:MlaD family protein n=1 Tax=unclassified Nocardioides TaxID=2615069 RepID=UPI00138F1CFA|nr:MULTISPECIES: MlaD family protein [unclassified Nocardioides]